SGRVSVEGMGLDSVTVTLSGDDLEEDATAMTDATGQYAFAGLAEGDYTVAISDFDNVSYVFENTSMDVTLGDDDVQIHNFMGMHARTGMISGMLFVDEAGKNDAYDEGEDALATPGILLSLIGPDESIIAPRPGATNASGMFMFDKLRAGAYQLVVNPRNLNPAIPADYAYGGSSTGYQFTLGVGGEATQNIPFDITHTTVNFMVNLKAGAAMGDALPGATVSFFSDMAGEQKIGDAMSGDDGMASMRIARTSASNNTVYAKVAAPAGDYATDMAMQAVMWDAKMTMHAASNASDILNTKADFSFSGATVMTEYGGGKALAGWAITVSSDKSAAADAPAKLGDDGSAKYSEVVAADSLPVKYTVNVASNQDNALDGGEKYSAGKTGLTYTHNGLSLPATMDAGMLEVKYTTQTLKVYVHHERDQVMGYTGNILGGDVRNTGTVNVDIRHIERSSGRSRAFNPNTEWNSGGGRKTDSNGVVTFRGVPANAQVIVQASLASDAGNVRLLRPDELAAYTDRDGNNIMGGAFGDNGGYHHTVELCPLMATDPTGQRFGECASFAFVNTHLVHGQVWKHDFVPAANGDGWTERNLRHVPGTTVTLAPVAGENLAGDGEGFTAAAADNRRTPLDERKQFNWGQKAAGVYKVTVPAGWVARVGAPGTNVALGNSFNPLAGDVQIDVTPTTGFAYGRVTGEDGFPVAGVTVNVNGVTATTDAAGRYTAGGFASQTRRISNVTYANRIFVEITHTGHNFSRTIRPFAANAPEMVNVELEGATKTATIAGRVTAAGTGDAVAGARVWVDYGAGATNPLGVSARTGLLTGSDGSYSATVVAQPAGSTVGISVTKSDMSFTPASIDVGALEGSSISGISFTGFMKATITGRVSNNGRPMDGVKVKAMAVGGSAAADSATTGETGSYRLFVPFGTYDVEASKAGFNFTPTNQRVNVGPGATTSIDDFAAVVVPSSDATLSDLMLSNDVSLAPTFASDVTAYTASAPNSVAQITVTATTANAGADAVIMPTDADDAAAGHQVDLAVGANEIT
ncbi:MAG: hypothetical protein F4029_05600, partial [Gammaproteobacteria bacterium]|nr:hypothetical protein [Gammaproteobacteria bacterium]